MTHNSKPATPTRDLSSEHQRRAFASRHRSKPIIGVGDDDTP